MNKLKELTLFDNFILKKINKTLKEKKQLKESEIPLLYRDLFIKYSFLDDIESLKRAIFIQWYSAIEPIENTGMGMMDALIEKQNLIKVHQLIENQLIDEEFVFLLNHYNFIGDWYFESFGLKLNSFDLESQSKLESKNFENRGVFGKYWKSILE